VDRLQEIRARLDAYHKDGYAAVVCDHFTADDIAWLLAEVQRLRTENGTELLPDESVAQDVTKQERP
jgi:hypothetical protein